MHQWHCLSCGERMANIISSIRVICFNLRAMVRHAMIEWLKHILHFVSITAQT